MLKRDDHCLQIENILNYFSSCGCKMKTIQNELN